ncbi:leucine--tRNA ligase [Daejeonella sp.]|uniref:leucine--tRNA ligase n=1 Tax=Daejeonella sp. TaxID=2805397 RepID=UPI0027185ADC|nr:leucine--tRNA ligase [Daejeonella sp.]MDO8992033.1 leucine--tRNA ligase [Daejeonella sp.]MDP2412919.1 leucine--tRNA ligase [Daejeonella sp.]
MDYQFRDIEKRWQKFWAENQTFKVDNSSAKPKYYVLDMFPYPSGAGLHVGHPLGYIASDIFARYKRLKGFNVLHPMGYDSFGLPAEQYAIQTGQHPAITTETNINRYREQLDNLGFSFDWSREVRTSDPEYYKWTQWIFMQLFNSWYNLESDKAESTDELIRRFENSGTKDLKAVCDDDVRTFSAEEWKGLPDSEKQSELLKYRLTYLRESTVNWCPALGTVLANDEVKDGYSERGGYPVEQKKMMQWSMRITAYADRLLQGLDGIDWPDPLKEMQRNWIGKSVGALVKFPLNSGNAIEVFTTRVDTIYGTTFLVLAPEHEYVTGLTTPEQEKEILDYIDQTKKKTELDRMADTKTVSGAFTGSYAKHPITNEPIPIWIADYVLAGYGTGAVMAVPSGDQRDWLFATKFGLPIVAISDGQTNLDKEADPTKEGTYINSGIINGLNYKEATTTLIAKLEELGAGKAKVNYRLRDAIFGRQRYWGEPVPVYFKEGLPYLIDREDLPLVLPEVDKYLPTESGEPPLGRAENWKYKNELEYELSTMPGWAGSSWYWYRYMASQDDRKQDTFAPAEAIAYWKDVDLYIGGSEHATGHLLYSRFWNKFLKDLGHVVEEEPFKKLINQGMIQGRSNFVYRIIDEEGRGTNKFVSNGLKSQYTTSALHVDVNIVMNEILDLEKFKAFRPEFANAEFILENGKYICGVEVEKMSKSKFNVVSPDDIIERFGADTLRMYEMFLGPLEQSKPWNTNGIEGVFKFLRKFWKLFHDDEFNFNVSDEEPSKAEFKALHKIIRKVEEDIERFSFNTSVSSFMICVNELTDLKCNKRKILQELVVVLAPYAPHITEELWSLLGNSAGKLSVAAYPQFNPEYLVENEFSYPVSVNGKTRMNLNISLSLSQAEVEELILANEDLKKYLDGKTTKKIIFVKGKIINLVV